MLGESLAATLLQEEVFAIDQPRDDQVIDKEAIREPSRSSQD